MSYKPEDVVGKTNNHLVNGEQLRDIEFRELSPEIQSALQREGEWKGKWMTLELQLRQLEPMQINKGGGINQVLKIMDSLIPTSQKASYRAELESSVPAEGKGDL